MVPKSPKPQLTHFLALPCVTDASRQPLERSLGLFKSKLAISDKYASVAAGRAVRPAGTIHLTLGVMSLADQEKVDAAVRLLHGLDVRQMLLEAFKTSSCGEGDVGGEEAAQAPLIVTLAGLESMHAATKSSVLYADPVDATGRLLPFSQRLKDVFTNAGILVPDTRPLKLHATILNTIYAKGGKRPQPGEHRSKGPEKFDSTPLLAEMQGYEWAKDVRLERVAICKMGAQKVEDQLGEVVDERYEEVAQLALP